jgi:hypothetical protein
MNHHPIYALLAAGVLVAWVVALIILLGHAVNGGAPIHL